MLRQDIITAAKEKIFSALQDPVLIVDEHNRLVELNPAATELLKITLPRTEATEIGETLKSFSMLARAIVEGASVEIDVGSYWGVKHFMTKISDLSDGNGRVIGKVVIMRDITKQKRLEKEVNSKTPAP